AFECLRISVEFVRKECQGDAAAKLQIFGGVNHAHAAATELFKDSVVGESVAGHEQRCRCEMIGGGREGVNARRRSESSPVKSSFPRYCHQIVQTSLERRISLSAVTRESPSTSAV